MIVGLAFNNSSRVTLNLYAIPVRVSFITTEYRCGVGVGTMMAGIVDVGSNFVGVFVELGVIVG